MESITVTQSYDLDFTLEVESHHGDLSGLPTGTLEPFAPSSWPMLDNNDQDSALLTSPLFAESGSYSDARGDVQSRFAFHLPEPNSPGYYSASQGGHGSADCPPPFYQDDTAAPIDPQLFTFPHDSAAEAAFTSRYLQPCSQPPRMDHSRMARPFAPSYTPCAWGSHCGISLDDLSPSGIARHLKEYHFREPSNAWHPKSRGQCQWQDTDGLCHKELNYASFGKHVAAVHLQSTSRACPYCFQQLGRADSLERHMKNYCPRSGRAEKKP